MSSRAFRLLRVSSTCVVALAVAGVAVAQSRTTVTAVANIKGAGGTSASAPFTVVVDQFAKVAERDALMAAVKKGGTAAARDLLAKRADAGSVELGGQRTAVKYVYARNTGESRLITAITAQPIVALGTGVANAKADSDLALVLLDLTASGSGRGELAPAAKVRLNADGALRRATAPLPSSYRRSSASSDVES
jgi:hypothetical protein